MAQSTGDGIFALFGAPVAHEDHPQRALHAARRMQEDLKRYADKLRERGAAAVIGSGRSQQRRSGGPIHPNRRRAYRIHPHRAFDQPGLALADPRGAGLGGDRGECQKFVEGYFQLKALGASRIKGVSEPVNVYEVTGLGPLRTRLQRSAGRGLTKFVGREREMEALKRAAEQAEGGRGQIVAAMAEAGVGKSRLFHEFKATSQSRLDGARDILGLARQGVGLSAGDRSAAQLFQDSRGRRPAKRREKGHRANC